MSDKTRTCDPTWAVVPEPDRPGDVPCLCRGEGGVEPRWREDSQLWHLRVGGMVYGVSRRARDVIAGALGLAPVEHTVPGTAEWPMVDGEPVVPGDVLWDSDGTRHTVESVRFEEVVDVITMEDGTEWVLPEVSGLLTRTEPPKPVLDRDGVPIEVGDTVWQDGGTHPVEVVDVDPGKDLPVTIRTASGLVHGFAADFLTHKRPDSWGRLEGDVGAIEDDDGSQRPCAYFGLKKFTCNRCPVGATEPCNRAMALDIVRRAKALAGVVGDE